MTINPAIFAQTAVSPVHRAGKSMAVRADKKRKRWTVLLSETPVLRLPAGVKIAASCSGGRDDSGYDLTACGTGLFGDGQVWVLGVAQVHRIRDRQTQG